MNPFVLQRPRRFNPSLFLLTALLLASGAALAAGEPVTLEHGGLQRRYLIDTPSGGSSGAPLVLALHDAASSGRALQAMTGLSDAALAAGMVVAYPSSAEILWNTGRDRAGAFPAITFRDDLGFLQAVIDDAAGRFGIDRERVYLVGYGSGGAMAFEFACRLPDRIQGLAVVAALLWDYQRDACSEDGGALPLLVVHGTGDSRYPPSGRLVELGDDEPPIRTLSLQETMEFWARRNGCQGGPQASGASLIAFDACRAPVALVSVAGAGHQWMRREGLPNATNLDAGRLAVSFLQGGDWTAEVPAEAAHVGRKPPRTYFVYAPDGFDPEVPTALVFVLHGRPGNGPGIAFITDMNPVADRHGFIAVYPESFDGSWNYTRGLPGYSPTDTEDDVAFLRTLAAELQRDFAIDPLRLHVTGFSNGGFMTQRLACEAGDQFASFAFLGATFVPEFAFPCRQGPTAPVLYMHGTQDASIPWDGLITPFMGRDRIVAQSAPDTIRFWSTRNVCSFRPGSEALSPADAPTRVVRVRFEGCLTGHDVTVYIVENGGHNWPGVPGRIGEEIAGNVNTDINAGEEVWEFFRTHPWSPMRR